MDGSSLFVNLAFVLGVALLGAAAAVRLGQSTILGYILAGIVIGPFTPGFVGDITTVQALAEIGIIFLLFSIGAQFSFRDLLQVGKVATVGGTVQVLVTIGVGYLIGIALGWPPLEALFLGAVISNSSSTVLGKVLSERGEADSQHGRIALGWSSVQGLGTIVLVVVLSALAIRSDGPLLELSWALGKATLFLVLVTILGSRALPWLFERVAALKNREVFILTVATVALGMAYISSFFGLSLALGAFVAGIVVGESDLSHQILGDIMPLRDIFSGLFFVSVGMLVNPLFVIENIAQVLLMLFLIIAKGALSALITTLAGYPIRTALLTGVTLAQSAEFSFLLARLGADLGAVTPTAFSLMLTATAMSIVASPNLHQAAVPLTRWLEARLPLSSLAMRPNTRAESEQPLRGHAMICGYGRVGRVIGAALRRRGLGFVIIDQDQRIVRWLRKHGAIALLGNAANPILLGHIGLERARVLVVAIPDPLAVRQIVDYARQVNRRLDIIVRTHSQEEREFLQRRGVREAVVGELELALEMTRHTLHRFGVSALETLAITQGLRERVEMEKLDERLEWED